MTDACEHCGHCTVVCTSNVRVHEEVRDFGEPPVKEYLDEAIETDYVGLK